MQKTNRLRTILAGTAAASAIATAAYGASFNIPSGPLDVALDAYTAQSGVPVIAATDQLRHTKTKGVAGDLSPDAALSRLLKGTGFVPSRDQSGTINILRGAQQSSEVAIPSMLLAQAVPAPRSVETVTVTSSKLGGADVQSIPIAITALSQEQLTASQTTGGPDLIKQVPNMTFTKTNFSGYSIQLRGIGTQAISVTTDPAVAVAFNDMPFIRNHFFEQEFFDVAQVEVLRGPQGTLYGRNATAGVVNITSAKPSDQFEAMASADIGNYKNRRFEAMLNLPIVDDRLGLRLAGEWTKRDGYSFNALTNSPTDGRNLWSGRATLGFKSSEKFNANLVWEHFQENDDRLRSSKQLCKRDDGPATIGDMSTAAGSDGKLGQEFLAQGCLPVSPYSDEAFQTPNSLSLPYYGGLIGAGFGQAIGNPMTQLNPPQDAYTSKTQPRDLRVIESTLDPTYKAKGDVFMLNADYALSPSLNLISQTGFNTDFLWATQDYNRFNTREGIFGVISAPVYDGFVHPDGNYYCGQGVVSIGSNTCANPAQAKATAYFCDPQLGCSNRMVAQDLVSQHSWQLNQEFRLTSHFSGPLNFSIGGNYMHYETHENYYVFFNTLTMYSANKLFQFANPPPGLSYWAPGNPAAQKQCTRRLLYPDVNNPGDAAGPCLGWIDVNPINKLDNQGHNYFLSQNPYVLNSYAGFGETYYSVTDDLKLTGGLRWTVDQKHFVNIPSQLLTDGYGYPVTGFVNQEWREWTGRFAANWSPKLTFTDQTLIYGSFAHGYKAGGANPPGATFLQFGGNTSDLPNAVHPLTFDPEFINAYELGSKNKLLDDTITFNVNTFYYDYKGYQISQIVDRTSINLNFDATVKGAELEASWEPLPGLRFNLSGGYQDARLNKGSKAIDLIDRTGGNPDWVVVKPFVTQASNCILPVYVIAYLLDPTYGLNSYGITDSCGEAYNSHNDPVTGKPFTTNLAGAKSRHNDPIPLGAYDGFNPLTAPNNGAGFDKDLSGNRLPNAPQFTTSFGAEYSMPITQDWAATLHGDFYWQSESWARVFNSDPYDRLRGYKNVNLSLILTNQSGWQVIGYMKNVFDTTAITGTFLNSDDSGLTTNIFLTDPRLFGFRVTKNW